MRVAIPELFAEPKPQEYAHTPYSMVYLHPGIRGAFKLMYLPLAELRMTLISPGSANTHPCSTSSQSSSNQTAGSPLKMNTTTPTHSPTAPMVSRCGST